MAEAPPKFDPLGVLATLDRHRVACILIGGFARVVQGAEEVTRSIDIVPSTKPENMHRLDTALRELGARRTDGRELAVSPSTDEPLVELTTDRGEVKIVTEPVGTRGYGDLRRAATREALGRGVRPSVASIDDLARMLAAHERQDDWVKLQAMRRLAEIERGLTPEM